MKKWLIAIVLVAVIGFVGYKVGMSYISDKVMGKLQDELMSPEEIEQMKLDPAVQDAIRQNFTEAEIKQLLPDAADGTQDGTTANGEAGGQKDATGAQPGGQAGDGTQADGSSDAASGQAKPTNGAGDSKSSTSDAPATSKPKPALSYTRKQAEQLVMGKFSLSELKEMSDKARKGLTDADKEAIMAKVRSRLTAEQYEALKVRVLIEVMKKDVK